MTPKIAFSETLDYVRWVVEGPTYACRFSPGYVRNATSVCSSKQMVGVDHKRLCEIKKQASCVLKIRNAGTRWVCSNSAA